MLPPVVECGGPDDVVDVILYEEVEHGIITRCTDPEGWSCRYRVRVDWT